MAKSHTGELVFFWILFGVVGYLSFSVMSSYLTSLFLAIVFSIVFLPVHQKILKWTKNSENISALITVLIALCIVILPIVFLGVLMFQEVFTVYALLGEKDNSLINHVDQLTEIIELQVQKFIPAFTIQDNITTYIEAFLRWLATNLNIFFSGILAFFLHSFIIIVAMFFLFRDGKRMHDFAVKWSPLADGYDKSIIGKLELAVSSVVKGALVTAIIQGGLVSLGFIIFGVPNPVLWGVVSTIVALIPLLGTSLVTVPASIWLLFTGNIGAGIGLIIWAIALVGAIDNFLRPYLSRKGMNVHPFLILLSVLGGLAYFGPIGFLSGPIVLAFFFALLDVYPAIISGKEIRQDASV